MTLGVSVQDNVVAVSTEQFEEKVLQHQGAVLVDFWADWCGPCRMLTPVLESLATYFGDRLLVAKVNVDENGALASLFKIQGLPALKLVADGKIVAEWTGYRPEASLKVEVEKALRAAGK